MHEGVDFLYEAVANSLEAEAGHIQVKYLDNKGSVKVRVEDDGVFDSCPKLFDEGFSTKRNHSGKGLYLLKQRCKGCVSLKKDGGLTVLEYGMDKEADYGSLKSILPLVFARCLEEKANLVFEFHKEGFSASLNSDDYQALNETETIIKIRNIVQDWE